MVSSLTSSPRNEQMQECECVCGYGLNHSLSSAIGIATAPAPACKLFICFLTALRAKLILPARYSSVVLLIQVAFGLVASFQRVTEEQRVTFTDGGPGLVPKSSPVNGDVCLPRASMLGLAFSPSP